MMKSMLHLAPILWIAVLAASPACAMISWISTKAVCSGPYQNQRLTPSQLQDVIAKHRRSGPAQRLDLCGIQLSGIVLGQADLSHLRLDGADLSNADLTDANLSEARLIGANLSRATLVGTNFQGADLVAANLSSVKAFRANFDDATLNGASLSGAQLFLASFKGASLEQADLSKADLQQAILVRANLHSAHLRDASMEQTDLREANLKFADLSRAVVRDADMTGSNLQGARLLGVTLDARPGSLPAVAVLGSVEVDEQLRFEESPQSLYALRQGMRDAGRRFAERQLTYAVERGETARLFHGSFHEKLIATIRKVAFDSTVQYGLQPARALLLLVLLIPVFAFAYYIALSGGARASIYRLWAKDSPEGPRTEPALLVLKGTARAATALQFSAMSAFQLGWRDLNVGSWMSRLQSEDYALVAMGWARSVAGIQSLVSVYLLALWVLTQFGRPFE